MKNLKLSGYVCAAGLAASILGHATSAQALIFDFEFDNTPDGTVTPPIIGTGTFSFDGDPGLGTFALTSLPNFDLSFDFSGGVLFDNADINTPLSNVTVIISSLSSDLSVNFSGTGGGIFGGSLDFLDGGRVLSFQPLGGSLYATTNPGFFGTYQALAQSPTPASVPGPLPLLGAGAAFGWSRRLRKRIHGVLPVANAINID
jgi:MYXO-CTERM domain-containing protein